jgi:hypothetical protein
MAVYNPLPPAPSTTTDPTGRPTSSPTTSIYNPLPPAPVATGTGTSTNPTELPAQTTTGTAPISPEDTHPQIWIATALPSAQVNAATIQFDYMPESVSFGVSAAFTDTPIPMTSGRWLSWQNSSIDEVSVTVKVVVGCNNCITYYGGNTPGSDYSYSTKGVLVTGKYARNSLIKIAQLLYSLPLPGSNGTSPDANGQGMALASPPPTCRFKVGKMFSGVGAFTGVSIAFNGPYDYDGSPTDMEVSFRFNPSEFYDSTLLQTALANPGIVPTRTPTGETLIAGNTSYALTFGDTQTGFTGQAEAADDGTAAATTPTPPNQGPETVGKEETPATVPEDRVTGPTKTTPTNDEVAAAMEVTPGEVYYDADKKTYTIGGTYTPGGFIMGGKTYTADWMQNKVLTSKVGEGD